MTNTKFSNYSEAVREDAQDFLDEYFDGFLSEIKDGVRYASGLIDDDGKLHEHLDQSLDLRESVDILEGSDNVETDSGLWEGLEPMRAIETQAFYTYKSDVNSTVREEMKERLESAQSEIQSQLDSEQAELDKANEKRESLCEELRSIDEEEDEVRYNSIEQSIEELDEVIEGLEEKVSDLQTHVDNIEDAIDDL